MNKIYTIVFFFSVGLTLVALAAFLVFGLNLGVDFKGGSSMEIDFAGARPSLEELHKTLDGKFGSLEFELVSVGDNSLMIRSGEIPEDVHQQILTSLKSDLASSKPEEKQFNSIGPVIGQELKSKSITAIVIVLLSVMIYIAYVFRKMAIVLSPWAMGLAAITALFHDIIIPVGVFAILGHYFNVEIGAVFVAALLTILGYSVSDTVVIFDRVRENVIKTRAKEGFAAVVHLSVMQTLTRSLNTTFTVLLSLIAIYLFGGESLRYFSLALIIGIFLGAYSSIFVASPLLVWLSEWTKKRR